MAWANPNNITTTNLDSNTDSPSLARADIKTAFDELTNVANNAKTSFTPAYNITAGTFTFTYNTQAGNYVKMGDIVFFELHIDANVLVSDATAFNAGVEITGLPANPSSTVAPVRVLIQDNANFTSNKPNVMRIQATGNKAVLFVDDGTLGDSETAIQGSNMSSGVTVNNISVKAKGWYLV